MNASIFFIIAPLPFNTINDLNSGQRLKVFNNFNVFILADNFLNPVLLNVKECRVSSVSSYFISIHLSILICHFFVLYRFNLPYGNTIGVMALSEISGMNCSFF